MPVVKIVNKPFFFSKRKLKENLKKFVCLQQINANVASSVKRMTKLAISSFIALKTWLIEIVYGLSFNASQWLYFGQTLAVE